MKKYLYLIIGLLLGSVGITYAAYMGNTGAGVMISSSTPSVYSVVAPGTSGNVLTSNGTLWTSSAPTAGSITINGVASSTFTFATSSPLTLGISGTTFSFGIPKASSTVDGYLSSTDWSTFNGKQEALVSGTNIKTVNGTTLLGSGDLGTIGTGYGGTGLASFTQGDILYYNTGTSLSKLAKNTTATRYLSNTGISNQHQLLTHVMQSIRQREIL